MDKIVFFCDANWQTAIGITRKQLNTCTFNKTSGY